MQLRHTSNANPPSHSTQTLCRIQKQQQAQLLAARLGSMDAPLADSMANGMTNGDHVATSAAAITERLGSGGSGGNPPKRVTPLQTSAASQSLSLGNSLAQVALPSISMHL